MFLANSKEPFADKSWNEIKKEISDGGGKINLKKKNKKKKNYMNNKYNFAKTVSKC